MINDSRNQLIDRLKLDDELRRRRTENPLKFIRQHQKQQECTQALTEFHRTIIALFWGNRVGKTEWGAQTVAKALLGEFPDIFKAPFEAWSFCPSFDEQKDTTQKKLLRYIPEHRIADRNWLRKGILKEILLDNGNKITFKSYEQGREKAQGAGKALIWFDEEPPKDIWEECMVRQDAGVTLYTFLTMTPIKGMTWVYNDIYLATDNPDLFVSTAGWDNNPWLTEEQKEKMSRNLSDAAVQVRRYGKFIKNTGLVCNWFDRDIHLIDIKELPFGDTYFGLDFGFSAPAAGLWVRIDREENLWVYDGFYRRGLINPDIQKIITIKEQNAGRVIRIGDSAQASDIQQLQDAGFQIDGVAKVTGTSKENWDEYRARLMEQCGRVIERTGKPKIFISKQLVDIDEDGNEFNFLLREIENLRWEEVKTELGTKQKSIWGKQPKHAIDALSYIIATISQTPQNNEPVKLKKKKLLI